jgi:hypothetical protein
VRVPIIELQRRLREAGRIRIGEKVATSNGKSRPAKIDRFRFTSSDLASMESIANVYGGTVQPWEGASVGTQWELYADTTVLDVIVPPVDLAYSQFMELWKGGGCERRCDGQTNLLTDKPCVCDPDAPDCKPTTRLGVILTAVQGIGVWRLETHGWNAASELTGAIEILRVVQGSGTMVPARLMLEQRQSKRDGKTFNFAVPVLDLNLSVAALTGVTQPSGATPIDATRPALPSIAEQAAVAPVEKPKRANAAATLPATGIKPPARGAEPVSVDEIKDEEPKPTKKPPSDRTEGGASTRSMRRLMAILNGHPEMPKGTDEEKQAWRHAWARDALTLDKDAPISFATLSQDDITLLNKVAEGQPEPTEDAGYGHSQEPF